MINIDIVRNEIIGLLRSTHRQGVEQLIQNLDQIGFFAAPASTKFHLNEDGGLALHSLYVCKVALKIREQIIPMKPEMEQFLPVESVIISTLLHDVCKSNVYRKAIKKRKNSAGYWEDYEGYDVDYHDFPLGHGEKSVIMLMQMGFPLTNDEIIAIRWHMTAWDVALHNPEAKSNLNAAKDNSPLLQLVQSSDGLAAGILEWENPKSAPLQQ